MHLLCCFESQQSDKLLIFLKLFMDSPATNILIALTVPRGTLIKAMAVIEGVIVL